ncbi:MAG TPA: D-aminoacylase [Thermoanaerobaculia bacterium]|nr:D-aminoacylase [Thermoanaerobaculia bacterium]
MRAVLLALLALTWCSGGLQPAERRTEVRRYTKPDYDLLILHGTIIDGTGKPRFRGDIGIRGDTIADIGDLHDRTATTTLDATGDIVAPGFIDLLGNSQSAVLIDPKLEGKVRQGVTTEVTGEGHSPGPIDEAMAAEMERTKPAGWPPVSWRTLGDFMRVVEKKGSAINFAFYVGAANPREMVLGQANRAPAAGELQKMTAIVDQSMNDGAVGLASALIYPPGSFATTDELTALAKHAGAYWTHMRSEGNAIDAGIDEAIAIARGAHVPLNIFHIKVVGQHNWGKMPEVLKRIEKSGVDYASCIYPYTATSTDLISIMPAWAQQGGYAAFAARLKDPTTRAKILGELRAGRFSDLKAAHAMAIRGTGKQLDEYAKALGLDPAEAVARAMETQTSSPAAIFFSVSEDDMKLALKQPWVAVCSDSGAVISRDKGAHPRANGTFTRILGVYVREEKLITLEEAIRKMTSLAASRAFLGDRGILRPGMKADVTVFNPDTIKDVATYDDPYPFSVGVRHVIVNGTPILRDQKMTGALPGRMLRKLSGAPPPPAALR